MTCLRHVQGFWAIILCFCEVTSAAPSGGQRGSAGVDTRIFISGRDTGIKNLTTPWRDQSVRWVIKSDAGTIAAGRGRTENDGRTSMEFAVPNVRDAVHLLLIVAPEEKATKRTYAAEVVVLPKDPFAAVRRSLEKLKLGWVPFGALAGALRRSALTCAPLERGPVREAFKGDVVILGGLLNGRLEQTAQWVHLLPSGTCLIVVNDGSAGASAFSLVKFLAEEKPPAQTTVYVDRDQGVWIDLPVDWLDKACPRHRLGETKGFTFLRILAGHFAGDGEAFPLALEARDLGGRWWLIWNLPTLPAGDDPRLDLILRNSLLWAHRRTLAKNRP